MLHATQSVGLLVAVVVLLWVIVESLIFMGYGCTRVVRLSLNRPALFMRPVHNNSHNKHNSSSL